MLNNVISRYRHAYRADEINLILRFAKRAESIGFIGIAGVGKSNIVNFLRDIHQFAPKIGEDAKQLHFPVVDATQWEGTPDSLWKMMINALDRATQESPPYPEEKVIPFAEEERAFQSLQERLRWICEVLRYQVMFILDDFDMVIESGPLAMLERLNGFHGERGYLSYLIFTKKLPHILGRNYNLENNSKFYDLFRHNIYTLEPYSQSDATRMLQHLNERAGSPLAESQLEQIYILAGGHAGLLRLIFNIWIEEGVSGIKATYFANKPDIQQECQRILLNLHEDEQRVALQIAHSSYVSNDSHIVDLLTHRGLIIDRESITWFSPLFAVFLATHRN